MTHPLFAAIDAAIASHGFPPGVKNVMLYPSLRDCVSIGLGTFGLSDEGRGAAPTAIEAYDRALFDKAVAASRAAVDARAKMRQLAQIAGIDPNTIPA